MNFSGTSPLACWYCPCDAGKCGLRISFMPHLNESQSMNAIDVLRSSLNSSRMMIEMILSDLSDADLMVRPVPHANHLAWQLGHLIAAERNILLEQLPDTKLPELPAGFAEAHNKEKATSDDAAGFRSKDEYVALLGTMREATIAELGKLSETDLDRPTQGNLAQFFPTLGTVFSMLCDHIMMHLGQASVVRRKLGKPVMF